MELYYVKLEGTNLQGASLVGASLSHVRLHGANLSKTNLQFAYFLGSDLTEVDLRKAEMKGVNAEGADFRGANLSYANTEYAAFNGADFRGATLRIGFFHSQLKGANLAGCDLSGQNFIEALMEGADLTKMDLRKATLFDANLNGANLSGADLREAKCDRARLREAILRGASLPRLNLRGCDLTGADLRGADFSGELMDDKTVFPGLIIDDDTCLGDVTWNLIYLPQMNWSGVTRLGDEARISAAPDHATKLKAAQDVTRMYVTLGATLRGQGLSDVASQFHLREQNIQRRAARLQRRYGAWLFSLLLDLVAGYGERPGRAFVAYLVVIFGFTSIYYGLGSGHEFTSPLDALIFSLTSFHGRGFFPGGLTLHDPLTVLAAFEAVIGLFIELIFIATFSRRFLGN